MKKKLALLMAAIMTVAMVPMTALAAAKTDITAVDQVKVAVDKPFTSRVELVKDEGTTDIEGVNGDEVEVILTLENAKFTKDADDDKYLMDSVTGPASYGTDGIYDVEVKSASRAIVTISAAVFNGGFEGACTLEIKATALELGDVVAKFSTNNTVFADCSEVIATVVDGDVVIATAGVVTFVEDGDDCKPLKEITIEGLVPTALEGKDIVLKLKGDYEFCEDDSNITVTLLNDDLTGNAKIDVDADEILITFDDAPKANQLAMMTISGIALKTTKKTDVGDVAKINVVSKDFDRVTLEVAKMVAEAVTYAVEDKKLPTIWAGADNSDETSNTLKVTIDENTGDILNTSRKATFTFPEGIEVVDIVTTGSKLDRQAFTYAIDENVVTIKNYSIKEGDNKTELDIKFILNAAPTYTGDVKVTLGGEFDDVEFTVATVKAPYTVEAKTSEVLIDYRYVPVNEIVITEAEEGILEDDDQIVLAVEKMDFEDAGDFEVTEGDIEVDVEVASEDIGLNYAYLTVTVEDDSTEASTIVISGLELYLDRTLPVGGYELIESRYVEDDYNSTILWENSTAEKEAKEEDHGYEENGYFKYEEIVVNDSYVEVVTQARDQDDYSTSKKIVITIGAPTMTVGTQVINLTTPAYINAENFTELPLRAVSEAFGADVIWDDATKTVTIMMGQRIVSMTIGGRTMYVNGTPVAMSTAPEITNDFTFVPVRDLANALGISKIDWNEAAATVTLN